MNRKYGRAVAVVAVVGCKHWMAWMGLVGALAGGCAQDGATAMPEAGVTREAGPTRDSASPALAGTVVVARMHGAVVTEAEVVAQATLEPTEERKGALFAVIRRKLVLQEAARRGIEPSDDEVDAALQAAAAPLGASASQLEAVMERLSPVPADQRRQVAAAIAEAKLLRLHGSPPPPEKPLQVRDRVVRCLWQLADVHVDGAPERGAAPPFRASLPFGGVALSGRLGLPEAELLSAIAQPPAGASACWGVREVGPALTAALLEAGYLQAQLTIRWKPRDGSLQALVEVDAGRSHAVADVAFDQSRVRPAQRVPEATLVAAVRPVLASGQLAALSRLRAATDAVNVPLEHAGLAPARPQLRFGARGKAAQVAVTFVVVPKPPGGSR